MDHHIGNKFSSQVRVFIHSRLVLALCMGFSVLQACAQTIEEPVIIRNLPYTVSVDASSDRHTLHLVLPGNVQHPPLLMWIPGGGWAAGNIDQELPFARLLAGQGIAVAVIDHRMSPAGDWFGPNAKGGTAVHPEHIEDVASAFKWIKSKAAQYDVDPEKIFVGGFSSGAHLSALLATDPQYLAAEGYELDDMAGVIPVGGAYELSSYYGAVLEANGERIANGHVLGVFGTLAALPGASPVNYISNLDVPMLVLSEADTFDYTQELVGAVKQAGKDKWVTFSHYPNETHRSLFLGLGDPSKPDFKPRREIMEFIHADN